MEPSKPPWLPKNPSGELKYEAVLLSGDEGAGDVPIASLGSGDNDPGQFTFWLRMRKEMMKTLGLGPDTPPAPGLSSGIVVSVDIPTYVGHDGFKGIVTSAIRGQNLSSIYSDAQLEVMGIAVPEKRKPKELRTDVITGIQNFNKLWIEAAYKHLKQNYVVEPATGNKVPIWDKAQQGIVEIYDLTPFFDDAYLAWIKEGGFEHDSKIPAKSGTSKLLRQRMIENFNALLNYEEIVNDPVQKRWPAVRFVKNFLEKLMTMPREKIYRENDKLVKELSQWGFIPEFLSDNVFQILDFYEPEKTAIDAREEICSAWVEDLNDKTFGELFAKAIELVESQGKGYILSQIDSLELIDIFSQKEKLVKYVDNLLVYPKLKQVLPFHILANPNIEDPTTSKKEDQITYPSALKDCMNKVLWEHDLGGRLYFSIKELDLLELPKYKSALMENFLGKFSDYGLGRKGLSLAYKIAPELVEFAKDQSFQPNHKVQFGKLLDRIRTHKYDEGLAGSISDDKHAYENLPDAVADTLLQIYTDLLESPEGPLKQIVPQFDRAVSRINGTYQVVKALTAFSKHEWRIIDFSSRPLSKNDFLSTLSAEEGFVYNLGGKDYDVKVNPDRRELEQLYLDRLNEKEVLPLLGQMYEFQDRADGQVRKLEGLVGKLRAGSANMDEFNALKNELSFKFSGGNYGDFNGWADCAYKPIIEYIDGILSLPSKTETDAETEARINRYLGNIDTRWEELVGKLGEISAKEMKAVEDVGSVIGNRAEKSVKQQRNMLNTRMEKYGSSEGEVYQKLVGFLKQWDNEYESHAIVEGLKDWEEKDREFWCSIYEGSINLKKQLEDYRKLKVHNFRDELNKGSDLGSFGFKGAKTSKTKVYTTGNMRFSANQIADPAILGGLLRQSGFFQSIIEGKIKGIVGEVWGKLNEEVNNYVDKDTRDIYPTDFYDSVSKIVSGHKGAGDYMEQAREFLGWVEEEVGHIRKNVSKQEKLVPKFKQNLTKNFKTMYDKVVMQVNDEVSAFFNNGGKGVSGMRYPGFPIYSPYSPDSVPDWFKIHIQKWVGTGDSTGFKSEMDSALNYLKKEKKQKIYNHVIGQFKKLEASYLKTPHTSNDYVVRNSGLLVTDVPQEFKSDLLDPAYIRIEKGENGYSVFCNIPGGGEVKDLPSCLSMIARDSISKFLNSSLEQVGAAMDLVGPDVRGKYMKTMGKIINGLGGV